MRGMHDDVQSDLAGDETPQMSRSSMMHQVDEPYGWW